MGCIDMDKRDCKRKVEVRVWLDGKEFTPHPACDRSFGVWFLELHLNTFPRLLRSAYIASKLKRIKILHKGITVRRTKQSLDAKTRWMLLNLMGEKTFLTSNKYALRQKGAENLLLLHTSAFALITKRYL